MKYLGPSQHIRLAMAARDARQAVRTENLSPNVLMMESAQDGAQTDDTDPLNRPIKPAHPCSKIDVL